MSSYTHELRYILMQNLPNPTSLTYRQIIAQGQSNLFDFDYPIFDENYRSVLQTKICLHYYTSNICSSSVSQFKIWLDSKLNEIMPYYNNLYTSEKIVYNPLITFSEDETYNRTAKQNGDSTLNQTDNTQADGTLTNNDTTDVIANSHNLTKNSDTPQGMLNGLDYYSSASDDTGDATNNTTYKGNQTTKNNASLDSNRTNNYNETNTDEWLRHKEGLNQNPADAIIRYREALLRVDQMIINELSPLFFGILD